MIAKSKKQKKNTQSIVTWTVYKSQCTCASIAYVVGFILVSTSIDRYTLGYLIAYNISKKSRTITG